VRGGRSRQQALKRVVLAISGQRDEVVPGAAVQGVVPVTARERVVAPRSDQRVVVGRAFQRIRADTTDQGVRPGVSDAVEVAFAGELQDLDLG